jgi:rhamnose transport system permease protein
MVIITRNVDLSVGSTVGLSAYVVGDLFKYQHIPVVAGFAVGIVLGAVVGAVNGLVTTVLRVPSLVVTLAMLYVIRGVDGVIVSGHTIDPSAIPRAFTEVGYRTLFGVPWLAIIVLVVVAVAGYAMRSFRASRDLYAIGSNPEAAALAGIPAGRRVFTAFVISGTLAGLAGALFLALHAQVDNSGGLGYELTVVAAVVVGGVAIFGGSGTVVGAALGALLLNTINQALVASKVSSFWNMAVAGGLLLAAIAFDRWLSLRVARGLKSARGVHRDV